MNEQLQQALTDLINKSMSGVDAATGFLAAEIPDVVSQLLMWHGVYSFMTMILGVSLLATTTLLLWKYSGAIEIDGKYVFSLTHDNEGRISIHAMLTGMVAFSLYIGSGSLINLTWLKIWIAPKVWLLEYAASFAK